MLPDFSSILMGCLIGILLLLAFAGLVWVVWMIYFFLSMPLRRAEQARLFLDVIEVSVKQGMPVEESIVSLAQSGDGSMGKGFRLLADLLQQNLPLAKALASAPQFLPPQISAMLQVGQKIGDLRKVLPACRQLLKDSVSQTRSAVNYLVILTLVITPAAIFVVGFMEIKTMPKLIAVDNSVYGTPLDPGSAIDYNESFYRRTAPPRAASLGFLDHYSFPIIALQGSVLLLLWLAALAYVGGPRFTARFPAVDGFRYRLPWRRKRMQRDFSTMLAILLDSGVPEPETVTVAADCSTNRVFRARAARAVGALQQGMKLSDAVQALDDSGEFAWRLTNAAHGHGGFLKALSGWHDSLDAKAFQQEQAASHGITTALVLWSGVFVGAVVIPVFIFLVNIIDNGSNLW